MKLWILSNATPEGNTVKPGHPDIFNAEVAAIAEFDKMMRLEWENQKPNDDAGDPLPYPDDPDKAVEMIRDYLAELDVDEPWGEWRLDEVEV